MKRYVPSKSVLITGIAITLAVGFGVGWLVKPRPANPLAQADNYPMLARRIFIDQPNDPLINFVSLRNKLQSEFSTLPAGTQQSFYFEYLPDGTSIRIGADDNLVAASLLKVPLVMDLYKAAEMKKISLDSTVTVQSSELDQAYGTLYQKGAGYQLTLRQAAQLVLENSDNTATRVIFDHVKDLLSYNDQSLAQLDIDQDAENGQAVINARSYTSVLKGLYYSSYLSYADSQEMLGYLAKSSETNRLTKDLPSTVIVAHKNGVYNSNSWAQSDCGIVYAPKRPYAICVMVGLPEDQADAFISQVSKEVYDYVTSQ